MDDIRCIVARDFNVSPQMPFRNRFYLQCNLGPSTAYFCRIHRLNLPIADIFLRSLMLTLLATEAKFAMASCSSSWSQLEDAPGVSCAHITLSVFHVFLARCALMTAAASFLVKTFNRRDIRMELLTALITLLTAI